MAPPAIPAAQEALLNWVASVIGVDYDDLADPGQFPMSESLALISAVANHPDLRSFFAQALEQLPKLIPGLLKGA